MLLSPRSLLFFRKDWVNASSARTFDTSRGDNSDYILIVFRKDWINGLFGRAFDTARVDKVDYILCVFRKDRIIVLPVPILEDVDKEVLIPFFSFGSVLFRVFCYLSFEHYDFLLIFPTLNADTKCSERL